MELMVQQYIVMLEIRLGVFIMDRLVISKSAGK
jgi:hypothetical protein